MFSTNKCDQPVDLAAYRDVQPVCISCDHPIPPGPVVVAIDETRVPLRIISVDILTTLGAHSAFTEMKALCPNAAAIVSGIASPDNEGALTSVTVQLCEPDSQAEAVWWQQLLGWAAHRQNV